jgi:acetyltransferase-like isoleucine patch superfamily enzyme
MKGEISSKARIGENVSIGKYTIIHDNVIIGSNSIIEDFCIIGYPTNLSKGNPLIIGKNSHIRSHSVFYEGSIFKSNLTTGHSVLVRENVKSGKYLQIGTNTDIEGDCKIADYVKIHTDVHIAKESIIGNLVWLYPRVQFTNDPLPPSNICEGIIVNDMAVIATGALILPGVNIGLGSFVGAGSVVHNNVPDVMAVSGNPSKIFARLDQLVNPRYKLFYPWPKHFRKGYPEESYELMDRLVEKINRLILEEKEKIK